MQIFSLGMELGLCTVPSLHKIRDSPTWHADCMVPRTQLQDDVGRRGGHTWRALVKGLRHPSVACSGLLTKFRGRNATEF